jgi:hypothetical protein
MINGRLFTNLQHTLAFNCMNNFPSMFLECIKKDKLSLGLMKTDYR